MTEERSVRSQGWLINRFVEKYTSISPYIFILSLSSLLSPLFLHRWRLTTWFVFNWPHSHSLILCCMSLTRMFIVSLHLWQYTWYKRNPCSVIHPFNLKIVEWKIICHILFLFQGCINVSEQFIGSLLRNWTSSETSI